MKHILPSLQIIFLVVAAVLAISSYRSDEGLLALAAWQLLVGICQLLTALFLSYKYWQSPFLKKLYVYYWLVVIFSLGLFSVPGLNGLKAGKGAVQNIIVFVIPCCIAVYFTIIVMISFYAKNKLYYYEK